jgi:hypothetical protein
MLFAARNKKPEIAIGKWPTWAYLPFRLPFVLDEKKLKTHCRVHGVSGSGKSKHLAQRISSHILQGSPCMLLDPHQDLADDVLLLLYQNGYFTSEKGYDNLLYIDFSNKTKFLPFNFLAQDEYDMYTIARNMVEVCTRVWPSLADGAAPTFENVMYFATLALIENKLPLPSIVPLIAKKSYRDTLLQHCTDPMIASFFYDQYEHWEKKDPTIAASTLRRANLLAATPALRFTLGQQENFLNFPKLLNGNEQTKPKSVIVNLHGLDEQTQKLLGCLISVGMEQATISRTTVRTPYYFFIDEFQSFSTKNGEAYSKFLSQARKFQVFLIISHQTNNQLVKDSDDSLLKAVGNITLEVHFRMSHDDAIYEAPRLFEHNPYRKKAEVEDQEVKEKHVPLFFPLQEHIDEKAWALKYLWPQHAYIKFARHVPLFVRPFFHSLKTRKIITSTVKITKNDKALKALEDIKKVFSTRYMLSESEVHSEISQERNGSPLQPEQPITRRFPVSS